MASYREAGEAINAAISHPNVTGVNHVLCKGFLNVTKQIKLRSNLIFEFDTLL